MFRYSMRVCWIVLCVFPGGFAVEGDIPATIAEPELEILQYFFRAIPSEPKPPQLGAKCRKHPLALRNK